MGTELESFTVLSYTWADINALKTQKKGILSCFKKHEGCMWVKMIFFLQIDVMKIIENEHISIITSLLYNFLSPSPNKG